MKNYALYICAAITAVVGFGCQSLEMPRIPVPPIFQDEESKVTDQQDFTQQVQVPANSRVLEVIHFNGNVTLEGWDETFILLEGTKRATGTSVQEARGKLEFISIYPYEKAPDRLVLEYNGPNSILPFGRSDTGIDVKISVPRNMPLEINCRRGDVKISNIQANVKIDHKDGDVNVTSIQGQATIESQGRNVIVKDISQRVSAKTVDANLSIENVKDNLNINHTNGEVKISNIGGIIIFYGNKSQVHTNSVRGRVQIENDGGDVECTSCNGGIQATIKNGSLNLHPKSAMTQAVNASVDTGDLVLRVPDNSSMLADLIARQGSIQSDFSLPISAQSGVSTAKGAVNGGQVPVTLSVRKGTLSLLKETP